MADERNRNIQVYVGGALIGRDQPAIPVFDSGFLHGKHVWSSPRLIRDRIFRLTDHLAKIRHGAELIGFHRIPKDREFIDAIKMVLRANKMTDGVHVRIILTAGTQVTASMNIASVVGWDGQPSEPRIVIIPEYRGAVYNQSGITLMTSRFRRPDPDFGDQSIHDNGQNHSSRACSEAAASGATAALLFDARGHLAEAHASHVGVIFDGKLVTPTTLCSPPGVTRRVIMELCQANGIEASEGDISAEQLTKADEIFLMGTMSGPVAAIALDGKPIGNGTPGPITQRISGLYAQALNDLSQSYDIFA